MRYTFTKLMLHGATVIVFASALAPQVLSQQPGNTIPNQGSGTGGYDQGRIEREREMRERERLRRDMREREFMLRMLEREARKPVERHEPQLVMARIREDFIRIQVVNNDLAEAVSRAGALDLAFIAKSASEIKKRAGRLKTDLMLPEPAKGAKRVKTELMAEPEDVKRSLSTLSGLIVGFVNNPMFKTANVIDAQQSVKARSDLEGIVALSEVIKKSCSKLNKLAQKTQ